MAPDPTGEEALAARAREQRAIGETHIARGELLAALAALRRELDLRRRIAHLAPEDSDKRAAAERAALRVAEVLVFRSAITSLRQGVNAHCGLDTLAKEAVREHDVAWTLRSAGRTLQHKGDVAGALALYREGLDIRRKLAEREPANPELLVDVTFSLAAIAEALAARGDLAGGLTSMNEALAIRRALAEREPENARRRLDVAWSLMGMADLLESQGEAEPALAALREALAIRRAASAVDPGNDGLRRDVGVSLVRLGDMQAARGDRAVARAAFDEARDIVRALVARARDGATARSDLAALDARIAAVTASDTGVIRGLASH